ncbi:hypothetical protein M514_00720 [Trichuris suis]|uniref:Uncharacterized protein n=1 Tax=Trichuris suis TaxID=68888 RepID=A0A085MMP8_9BILA|nr:hypothetical protein M513_00720 [Trichuris suis]KFD65123.1 hypothetical protein M514_00720 [Trichuris suis]
MLSQLTFDLTGRSHLSSGGCILSNVKPHTCTIASIDGRLLSKRIPIFSKCTQRQPVNFTLKMMTQPWHQAQT